MKRLIAWVLENLDTALAVILCIFAAIFGTFGIFQTALMPAIAGALALISISIIRDRKNRDSLEGEVRNLGALLQQAQSKPNADKFFGKKTPDSALIQKAKEEIWLIQETGSRLIEENFKLLEMLMKRGVKVKVLIPRGEPEVLRFIAYRNKNLSESSITSRRVNAFERMQSLAKAIKGAPGTFEIRQIPYPLDITATFIDPEGPEGSLREGLIRMSGFRNFFDDKLDFVISCNNEPETFQHFVQQFKDMWECGEALDILHTIFSF